MPHIATLVYQCLHYLEPHIALIPGIVSLTVPVISADPTKKYEILDRIRKNVKDNFQRIISNP